MFHRVNQTWRSTFTVIYPISSVAFLRSITSFLQTEDNTKNKAKMGSQEKGDRTLLITRHGERCDFTFSASWMNKAFDADGRYRQFDLNSPRHLPKRSDGFKSFAKDTPLTEMGYLQCKLTGRALRDNKIKIDYIYCSPSLRCVQTAVGILKGYDEEELPGGNSPQINIEPGLFEWMHWLGAAAICWLPDEELKSFGYPINTRYTPCMKVAELRHDENIEAYYKRSFKVTQDILKRHPQSCTILFVGHSATLDVCSRQLVGEQPRNEAEFYHILQSTPYLATTEISEKNGVWTHKGSPIQPLTHTQNQAFLTALLTFSDADLKDHIKKNPIR